MDSPLACDGKWMLLCMCVCMCVLVCVCEKIGDTVTVRKYKKTIKIEPFDHGGRLSGKIKSNPLITEVGSPVK